MTDLLTPDIAPSRDAPSRSHSAKRMSVLDAASEVFCREGYAGANIDMVAMQAGVSRQTIYNHHGDKEKLFEAVVRQVTERMNADIFDTFATFPDKPTDLQAELAEFAMRLSGHCMCSREGKFLRKLILAEGERYPELFSVWREDGPGKTNAALAARFARLALAGHLELEDPDLAARQFVALINADTQITSMLGIKRTDEQLRASSRLAVETFLRAYGRRTPAGAASG